MKQIVTILVLLVATNLYAGRKYSSGGEIVGTNLSYPKQGHGNGTEGQTGNAYGSWGFGGSDRTGYGHASYGFFDTGAQTNYWKVENLSLTKPLYLRIWIKLGITPPSNAYIFSLSNNVDHEIALLYRTDGKVSLNDGATQKKTTAGAVPVGSWMLVKVYTNWKTSGDTDRITINGETLLDTTAHSTAVPNALYCGFVNTIGTDPGTQCNIDDIALNDASGSNETGAPDDSGVVLFVPPVSDNALGGWTGGSGGTTALYAALNAAPPPLGTDTASETNNTNIKNKVASATDNFDVNCMSYTNVGVPAGKAIKLVQAVVRHGEHSLLSAVSGAVEIVSNPADAGETSFTFGDGEPHRVDENGTGLDTTHWLTTYGAITYNPAVSRSTQPVVRVGKRTASTNQVCADVLGIQLEFGTSTSGSGMTQVIDESGVDHLFSLMVGLFIAGIFRIFLLRKGKYRGNNI